MPERTCNHCKTPLNSGQRRYCSHLCANTSSAIARAAENAAHPQKTCEIDGCSKPARSRTAELCKMHYHRQYRHGSTSMVATRSGVSVSNGRKYKTKHAPRHPLASKHGIVYVHRMVLFDAIGYGPHACHWCGTEVDWKPKGTPGELQPDHLNNQGDDNRLENLAPSCRSCNAGRAGQARSKALREAGWWSGNDTIAHLRNGGRAQPIEAA